MRNKLLVNSCLEIRCLDEKDLTPFFQLRLEALQNSPTSFLVSYEEEKGLGPLQYKDLLLETNKSDFIFGAFIKQLLIGFIAGIKGKEQILNINVHFGELM